MKISDVTTVAVKDYCRAEHSEEESLFEAILAAAKQYIISQTGLTAQQCDEKADLTVALFVLCSDMYENRLFSSAAGRVSNVNKVVDSIISQYSINLL